MCRHQLKFCFVPSYTASVTVILFTVLPKGTVVYVLNYCDMKMHGELRCNSTYSQASCSGCFSLGERESGTLWGARPNFPTYHGVYVVNTDFKKSLGSFHVTEHSCWVCHLHQEYQMPMKMSVMATADQKVTQLVAPETHFIIKCRVQNAMSLEFK
jgi:hypothetical protein